MKFNKSYLLIPLLTSLLAVAGAWPLLDGLRATLFDGSRIKKLNSECKELYSRISYAEILEEKVHLYGEVAKKCDELAKLYERNRLTEESAEAYCNAGDALSMKAIYAKLADPRYSYFETERCYSEAVRYYSEAAERYKQLSNIGAYAEVLASAGEALYGQAESIMSQEEKTRLYSKIASKHFEAAEQYKQLGNTEKYAELLYSVGRALYGQANNTEDRETKDRLYDEAIRNYHEVAELHKQSGDTEKYAEVLYSTGQALYAQANNTEDQETKDRLYDEAIRNYHEVAELYKQSGDTEKYAEVLYSTGQALYAQANNTEDQETKDRLYREADNNYLKAAELYTQRGKVEKSAQVNYEFAQQLGRRAERAVDNRAEQSRLYGEAAERFAEEERLYREIGNVAEADNAASEREEMLFRKSVQMMRSA